MKEGDVVPAKLIAFCGLDGSGKTTLARLASEHLRTAGHQVLQAREPTTAYRALPFVRSYLDRGERLVSMECMALAAAFDRKHQLDTKIMPSIQAGTTVVLDRYLFSTYVYFEHRGVDPDWLREINRHCPPPDLGFYCHAPTSVLIRRIQTRDGNRAYEESTSSMQRLEALFEQVASEFALVPVDTSGEVESAFAVVRSRLNTLCTGVFG